MTLTQNPDGTYTCQECHFIFGPNTVRQPDFAEYHTNLHGIVIRNKDGD
jgi:hypothetical protein